MRASAPCNAAGLGVSVESERTSKCNRPWVSGFIGDRSGLAYRPEVDPVSKSRVRFRGRERRRVNESPLARTGAWFGAEAMGGRFRRLQF